MSPEMTLEHTEARDGITYRLYIEQDDSQVRGSFASGDDKADERLARRIEKRLDDGDTWAWCSVKVEAVIEGVDLEGVDYLGACSYRNVKDFIRKGGYYADMCEQAKEDLFGKLRAATNALTLLGQA